MKKRNGISAGSVETPIIVTLFVLHALIIALILMISSSTSRLSTTMSNSGKYTQEATSLVAGVGLLSETCGNYILLEDDNARYGNIIAYAKELSENSGRYDNRLITTFAGHPDVPEEAVDKFREATNHANRMIDSQLHAIALYGLPDIPRLQIPAVQALRERLPELKGEELTWDETTRKSEALKLVVSSDYSQHRRDVSNYVNECVGIIQSNSAKAAEVMGKQVDAERTAMWVATIVIISLVALSAFLIHVQIVRPLVHIARNITTGETVNQEQGLREVRTVAKAYNKEHNRRDALDAILRSAAETDELTGIPNRYCYEQYLLSAEENDTSAAVAFFDINFLKATNDKEGHMAGDNLIRAAAESIVACFGKNCFRLGGDEFVAIVKDCTIENFKNMVRKFDKMTKDRNISISFGWEYAEKLSETDMKSLVNAADKKMYEHKYKLYHEQGLL